MTTIAMEEYELMKDSKYRMYVAAVDKALKNFEYTSEWADLISALGKLNKVLTGYTKFPVIPRRIKISKRLAQCMHPALPSGVHLKALETYDIIFRCMGTNRLSYELFIYSAGLFPLLGHAAMNIRPTLLTVYERHFVPLRERLRPALSGFLSGVLPGLETGSDHFDRTNTLLENVCDGVGPAWFYTCIWQCVRSNSPVRLPAISYVLAHYTRKASMEDQLYLIGNDIDVMISGLCAAVQDSSVLVQRSALDLLMVCFPMHNTQLLYADMVRLVTAALSTILRRDMSLNRRLYSWLLSTEINNTQASQNDQSDQNAKELSVSNNHTVAYDLLNEAIRVILKQSSTEIPLDVKPYRLLTSLFDKPQIGLVILDNILYDVFRALYLSCLNQQKHKNNTVRCVSFNGDLTSLKNSEDSVLNEQFLTKNCQELIKNANLLFNTLQSYYIWSYIEKLYKESVENCVNCKKTMRDRMQVNEIGFGAPNVLEICILTDFLLDIIPIESYAENTSEILPNLFNKVVCTLKRNMEILNCYEITQSLKLCTKILSKIQPITVTQPTKHDATTTSQEQMDQSVDEATTTDNTLIELTKIIETKELKTGLEKSKSDSRINENMNKNELTIINNSRERSNSNQMLKKKEKSSPKIEKKSKNKKSKSSSKLYDLKKDEQNEINEPDILVEKVEQVQSEPIIEIITTPCNPTKIDNKYFIKCLEEYKKFYVTLIKTKILPGIDIRDFFKTLVRDKEERTRNLEKLLDLCLTDITLNDDSLKGFKEIVNKIEHLNLNNEQNEIVSSEYDETMAVASNILLEFSSFPNILSGESVGKKKIPHWVETLIVCACYPKAFIDIQITAMNTVLEIFSLAKSQNFDEQNIRSNVIIMGILEKEHVLYVEDSTIVLEVMSQTLWDILGNSNNQKQLMLCVTLFYQIHNIFDTQLFAEDVLGKYLIDETLGVEFFKRFSLLWHLGRDLNIKLAAHQNKIRNFDRSLLKILDNLNNTKKPNLRLLSETFLTHSLLRNDIPRIISPILTKLLTPSTARISIKHVNIHDSDSQTECSMQESKKIEESKAKMVSAVSGINGNIMYHFVDDPSPKPSKKKWFLFSKAGKKYTQVINMTTSITENSNIVTKKNKDFKNVDVTPNLDCNGKNNVKLFINPLGSKEIYPIGINGSYTKIDTNSSTESLSSSNDLTQTSSDSMIRTYPPYSLPHNVDRDSGFESLSRKSQSEILNRITSLSGKDELMKCAHILEHIEPISDGIKTEKNKLPKSQSFDEKTNSEKIAGIENLSLVHSWSYCVSDSDNLHAELELSTSAEDFFKGSDHAIVLEVLNDIINNVCSTIDDQNENFDCKTTRPVDLDLKPKIADHISKNFVLYPMHYHLCLYYEVFDSNHILYALKTLKNCLLCNPQLFIRCLATSGLKDLKNNDILCLLARHRKSIFGGGFSGKINQEYINFYRGYMFLDAIISICLNFARSFYPSLDDQNLTKEEMNNNLKIQLGSLEILDIIIKNLIIIVNENSKGFSSYIADMLIKCKLQKVLLHCLLTSVRNFDEDMTFAEEILLFNHFQLYDSNHIIGKHVEAFQIQLLRLIHSLIILEYHVFPSQESNATVQSPNTPTTGEHLSYTPTILIPQQQMFLSAIMSALRHQNMKSLHEKWCNMVTSCLPYFGENLKQISLSVIHQICNNIEEIANNYKNCELEGELCSDYAVTQLESLTILCHYCLLDSSQSVNQGSYSANANTPSTNEILNNLVNVFFSPIASDINPTNRQNSDYYQNARKTILSHMPRIISSVARLWQTIVSLQNDYSGIFGNAKVVRQQLLEFLSPISVHHSASFLAAIAVAWYERKNPFTNVKTVLPEPNASQSNLVYLISAIRVIPLDNLVQTVTAVIKNPPPTEGLNSDICLDVSVLELFYCYMRNASATQLSEAWASLLALVREGCSLSPPAQFLLAALLHELMIKCCPLEERKDQKDLQDATAKLIECVSQVCGSCLEQTTWLRRNLAVKEQQDEDTSLTVTTVNRNSTEVVISGSNYSVQAQLVLSEILAPILDICFGSQEKDKVNTILTSLMYNIVPYLRTHTIKNMPSFQACSKLLASLSSYQYTRKAWKKDVFDLLLDNALFQMDIACLRYWKVIVDNLMTHDTTTFRDLMSRVSMTQSGSLSIFSSREQEYEQRAQLLKRLAFVIFCSEMDQYAKYMPDIQEQLTSSLRLSVPGVQAQVFLCFRVILIRMSPMHVTSLWPIIISEMLQVFLQIEQELTTDTEEFSSHIKLLSSLDASWATNSSNGLHALGHPHWLRLQLATAKLLDLALLLPATSLPQFQMYRWAFVGDDLVHVTHNQQDLPCFTPHVTRIASLMDQKFADTQIETLPTKQNELLLTTNNITQLKDLHGFFKTLSLCSNRHRTECSGSVANDMLNDRQLDKKMNAVLEKLDKVIEMDFLDKIPR